MKLVVVGRNGQLARALARLDENATVLGRAQLDLAKAETIEPAIAAVRPDVVINAAAYTAVDQAETDEAGAMAVNHAGVGLLAQATAHAGAALIHISTDYVYAGDKATPYHEEDPVAPINAYGRSKLAGEEAAMAACAQTVILRTSWVYSPWGRNFVRTMLRLGGDRDRLDIVADQFGQPTSALDLARACLKIAHDIGAGHGAEAPWGVYHYAGAGVTSWADFAREIFHQAHARGLIARVPDVGAIPTTAYPTPARRPANSALDLGRISRAFSLSPIAWQDALSETLEIIATEEPVT